MQGGPCMPETGPRAGGVTVCTGVCSPQPASCSVGATRAPVSRCGGARRWGSAEWRGQWAGVTALYSLRSYF